MSRERGCCCSVTQLCLTLCDPMDCSHVNLPCPSISPRDCSNSCPLNQSCHATVSSSVIPFFSCLQSLPASGSFPKRWLKYWSFCFSICPSNEYSGLISFRVNWFDLLEVQGTHWLIGCAWVVLVLKETLRWGSLCLLS